MAPVTRSICTFIKKRPFASPAARKITFSVLAPNRANHFRTLFRSLTMSSGRGPRWESEPSLFIR
jgi:hypothetical protein